MKQIESELVSLNKYISSSGFCSRREADKLIESERVTVNDLPAFPGDRVMPGDKVEVDGEPIKKKKKTVYIACNKPVGVTSTTDVRDKTNIITFLNHPTRIFPVGRLDKDSDGLILLTNDGDIVNKILRASNNHEKEYIVIVDKNITPEFIQQMSNGIPILGTRTKKCEVRQEGNKRFRITLTQGLNRQIRRMCEYLGYEVQKLTRIRIMNINLEGMAVGHWRYLSQPEMEKLNDMMSGSSSEVKPGKPKSERKPFNPDEKPESEKETKARLRKEAFLDREMGGRTESADSEIAGVKKVTSRKEKAKREKENYFKVKKEKEQKAGVPSAKTKKKGHVVSDFESASIEEQSMAVDPMRPRKKKSDSYKGFRDKGDKKDKPGFDAKGNKIIKAKKEPRGSKDETGKRDGKVKREEKGKNAEKGMGRRDEKPRRLRQSDSDAAKKKTRSEEKGKASTPKGKRAAVNFKTTNKPTPRGRG
ncbi:23S rRNA pseudouridine(2604) synthase RluF [Flavipsychrobacter stenotrophus]|uniref:Pseudouridine synthase n=1 Tax=Flavipsychrobacter stenotrophus TaxID=2077091 RepID=A0A2S7SR77_9BACT|nr:23S rRNA pseudouridine(2604) synthase RluF [Flavipsychrobacter stenotrophus]PQJ09412.1 23S rRNA pseudouridine(2604) synthase RluF [Flavipsychrobacter stenotrophus]